MLGASTTLEVGLKKLNMEVTKKFLLIYNELQSLLKAVSSIQGYCFREYPILLMNLRTDTLITKDKCTNVTVLRYFSQQPIDLTPDSSVTFPST